MNSNDGYDVFLHKNFNSNTLLNQNYLTKEALAAQKILKMYQDEKIRDLFKEIFSNLDNVQDYFEKGAYSDSSGNIDRGEIKKIYDELLNCQLVMMNTLSKLNQDKYKKG